jgi:hypothetical protein
LPGVRVGRKHSGKALCVEYNDHRLDGGAHTQGEVFDRKHWLLIGPRAKQDVEQIVAVQRQSFVRKNILCLYEPLPFVLIRGVH